MFNNLRIREEDKQIIAFIIQYSLYQYKVMLFGLYNRLVSQQRYINNIIYKYLDNFIIVYLDNLLIYSSNLTSYKAYIRKVLVKLREASLLVNINKYKFHTQKVKYLGLIIILNRLKIDPIKVEAIVNQKLYNSIKDI